MLVATTVIATIRVAITSVRAAISLVMPPRRGAEAMNHAAASSTEPRVLATLTIVISCARPRPRPRSRAGSTFAATFGPLIGHGSATQSPRRRTYKGR